MTDNPTDARFTPAQLAALPPIDFAAARARFEREAVRGVCRTRHYRMPYTSWGAGPPLVFVHGAADFGRSFLLPMALLSHRFRCIAYDLPTGRGDRANVRTYRHADLVQDLWDLLDDLGLPEAFLLGASFGSTVVLTALHDRPKRAPRAILQGGLAWRPLGRRERFFARLAQFIPGTMGNLRGRERVLWSMHKNEFAGRPPEFWRYFIDTTAAAPISSFAKQALLLDRIDLRPLLPSIHQELLLICGDRDRVIPRPFEEVLLAGLPNARRITIEGCGHIPSYTHPEAFAELITRFLTAPPVDEAP
jgi:pimeloyl-ACP methyl ester carboxylesterase